MHAVDFSAAGQRAIKPRQRPRRGMAVGGGNFRTAPFAGIDGLDLHQSGRIGQRLGTDRLGILECFGEKVGLPRRRRIGADHLRDPGVVLRGQSDMEIEIEWLCEFLAEVGADALSGDAPQHLADQDIHK